NLIKLAAATAVATTVGASAAATRAAAIDPNDLQGSITNITTATTEIRYHNPQDSPGIASHVLWVQDGARTVYPEDAYPRNAAISGWSGGLWVNDGVEGVTEGAGYGGNFEGRGATEVGSASG